MIDRSTCIALVISRSLKQIKAMSGQTLNFLADSLEINQNTFLSYYYGVHPPSLATIIHICNYYSYSINSFLGELLIEPNEQQTISRIYALLQSQPEIRRDKIRYALCPMISSMMEGFPAMGNADCGTKIRILREDICESREIFAKRCNISPNTLKNIESEQPFPGVDIFCDICNALCISPEYLLTNTLSYIKQEDRNLYSLTPRQIKAVADTISRLCVVEPFDFLT